MQSNFYQNKITYAKHVKDYIRQIEIAHNREYYLLIPQLDVLCTLKMARDIFWKYWTVLIHNPHIDVLYIFDIARKYIMEILNSANTQSTHRCFVYIDNSWRHILAGCHVNH